MAAQVLLSAQPHCYEMNDVEGKAKGTYQDEEAKSCFDDPLGDGVVHNGELATKERIAHEEEDELNPGKADCERRDNLISEI